MPEPLEEICDRAIEILNADPALKESYEKAIAMTCNYMTLCLGRHIEKGYTVPEIGAVTTLALKRMTDESMKCLSKHEEIETEQLNFQAEQGEQRIKGGA